MSKASFESDLRSSLRGLSQAAPTGPTQASVLDALHARTRRHQKTARLATLTAALVVLAVGLSWLVLANIDRPVETVKPSQVSALDSSEKGGPRVDPVMGNSSPAAVFNTTALLGHMNDIPFERNVILRVAGLDEAAPIAASPAVPADSSPAIVPGWNPKLDLDKVDFAYLPDQGDCIFCVALPSLSGQQPF